MTRALQYHELGQREETQRLPSAALQKAGREGTLMAWKGEVGGMVGDQPCLPTTLSSPRRAASPHPHLGIMVPKLSHSQCFLRMLKQTNLD